MLFGQGQYSEAAKVAASAPKVTNNSALIGFRGYLQLMTGPSLQAQYGTVYILQICTHNCHLMT